MLDHKILQERLEQLGYTGERSRDARVLESLKAIAVTLDSYELTEDEQDTVLDLLVSVGNDKLNHLPDFQEEYWEDFNYGNVPIGSFVRVKKDAYDTEPGSLDNGLVGVLSFMSHGRCVVDYLGIRAGKAKHHPMSALDSLRYGVK